MSAAALAFDPADWFARFSAAGGWYVVANGDLWCGWCVAGLEAEAREIWREVQDDADRLGALAEQAGAERFARRRQRHQAA